MTPQNWVTIIATIIGMDIQLLLAAFWLSGRLTRIEGVLGLGDKRGTVRERIEAVETWIARTDGKEQALQHAGD